MPSDTQERWIRLGAAASQLGVSSETLRRWADQGKVECWRTPGGERRFSAAEIARLVSGQAS